MLPAVLLNFEICPHYLLPLPCTFFVSVRVVFDYLSNINDKVVNSLLNFLKRTNVIVLSTC